MAFRDLMVGVGIDSSGFRAGVAKLRSEAASLKTAMGSLASTITEQVRELNKMAKAGDTTSQTYKDLEAQIKKNEKAFKAMGNEAKWVDKQLQQMEGPKMGGMMKDIGGALTGGIIGGGVAGAVTAGIQQLQQTFNETLKVAADFDDQLRKISATSGATSEEMVMLRDTAVEWGAKSAFSASESAQAMQYMAQAGWSAQQSMAGLPGVLNLAASSGEDLAMTASIVTDGLTAFKLEAADSARFADVLAAAAAASNTNVAKMGDTFRYVGPVAGALGFTIEDTALAIGLMANSGIKGEQAGTSLRGIISRLAAPTTEVKKAMEDLGVSLVDSAGKTRPLSEVIQQLRAGFAELTPAQQAATATTLAEREAMSGLLAIVTASEQSVNELSEAIVNSNGKAQEMADIMEGGVGGSLRKMQGAWESLQLTITGSGSFAQVWYDGWATIFDKWAQDLQGIKKDYHEFRRILQIGLFDALKESEQTKGIEAFGKAYKKALDGFPTDKLTDQMTRLTWVTEGQTLAFNKRNEAVMAKLAPPKDLEEAVKKANEKLGEGEDKANNYATAIGRISETASTVFAELQVDLAKSADFYRIMDDEVGALSDRHALLEGAIKKAWSAGGSEAEQVIRNIKAQLADMTAARLVPEVKGLPMRGPSQVVSTTATGLQLPKINTTAQADLDAETESLDRQRVAVEALQGAYTSLGQSLGASMEALAAGTGTAADALRGLGYSALESAQKFIQAEIAKAIAAQISSNSKLGAIGIGLAGVAIAGIFGLMRGALSQSKSVKLAKGGIISGRTMAEVGEYPGAAFNPEVVAPLDKLQAMLDIGGSTHVTGTFRVQGADLVLALDNAQRKMNKFRV